ncbi:MAG: hypothetical protein OHK0053_18400 [Microscillaceae bacterium]
MKSSIFRHLAGLYLLLTALALGGATLVYWQANQLQGITRNKVEQYRNVKSLAINVEAELNQLAYLSYSYLLFGYAHIRSRAEGLWEQRVGLLSDSLTVLVQETNNPVLEERVLQINKDLAALKTILDNFYNYSFVNAQDRRLIRLDKEFDILSSKIRRDLINIAASQESDLKFALLKVEQNGQNIQIIGIVSLLLVLLGGSLYGFWLWHQTRLQAHKMAKHLDALLSGELPTKLPKAYQEFSPLQQNLARLQTSFDRLRFMAEEVGKEHFETNVRVFEGGVMGQALAGMRQSLSRIATENLRRNWSNEGFAQFSEILRNSHQENTHFYSEIIRYLVNYLDIHQGGIFALQTSEEGEEMLVLKAAYAFGRNKYPVKQFRFGEGLVGEVWRERDLAYVTDVPENYAEITSGLGRAKPRCLLMMPLITSDSQVIGVIELAAFEEIEAYKIEFIRRVSESISATIARLKIDADTQLLLRESQEMAEKMKAQEEEMRQNMDTLLATQNQLERNAQEMQAQLKALDESFIRMELDTKGHFTKVNELIIKISGYSQEELIGQHFTMLLGHRAGHEAVKEDWDTVLGGQYIKGEFVRYAKNERKFWIYEVVYPLFNAEGFVDKIQIVGYDISKQKEQEFKIKEQLNELQMSRRDVVNRIREVEGKARTRMEKMKMDFMAQLQEKERLIAELKSV